MICFTRKSGIAFAAASVTLRVRSSSSRPSVSEGSVEALSFFERPSEQRVVTAFRSHEPAHAVSERKTDTSLADLLDQIVARLGTAWELIKKLDEFLVGKWLRVLG
jgi:phosphoribosylcarboxyaminoimidazole (NCAIR) mutase